MLGAGLWAAGGPGLRCAQRGAQSLSLHAQSAGPERDADGKREQGERPRPTGSGQRSPGSSGHCTSIHPETAWVRADPPRWRVEVGSGGSAPPRPPVPVPEQQGDVGAEATGPRAQWRLINVSTPDRAEGAGAGMGSGAGVAPPSGLRPTPAGSSVRATEGATGQGEAQGGGSRALGWG